MTDRHHQNDPHSQRHPRRRNWSLLVVVALMLMATFAYILSMDEAWRPFRATPETPAPGSAGNDQ